MPNPKNHSNRAEHGLHGRLEEGLASVYCNPFFRNVATVITGTIAAQAITVVGSPFLARVYDPTSFGVFGVFVSVATITGTMCCWAYDWAIAIPSKQSDAANLLGLALFLAIITAMLSTLAIIATGDTIAKAPALDTLSPWLALAPAGGLIIATHKALTFWSARHKDFRRIAASHSTRSLVTLAIQASAGIAGFISSGLVLGFLAGQLAGTLFLAKKTWQDHARLFARRIRPRHLRRLAAAHIDFPKYRAPQQILVSSSKSSILITLAFFFGAEFAGLFALAQRAVYSPLMMVAQSIQQVFIPAASETYHSSPDLLLGKVTRLTCTIFAITLLIVSPILILGPNIFELLFGIQWREAGHYAQLLAIAALTQVTAQPSESIAPILNLQRFHLLFQSILMFSLIAAVTFGGHVGQPLIAIGGYALCFAIFKLGLIGYMQLRLRRLSIQSLERMN